MDDTPDTHRAYPYAFCLSLAYELKDGILFMEYQVENRDQRDMWYAIGAHPGFNCPMEEGFAFEDYQLVFEKEVGRLKLEDLNLEPGAWTPIRPDMI